MKVYPLKKQYQIINEILKERLDKVLPKLMVETGIEFWLVLNKEYNEDPIFESLTPANYPTARRLSILAFLMKDNISKRFNLGMPDPALSSFYAQAYQRDNQSQFEALSDLINQYQPKNIGINYSEHFAYCDGLSVGVNQILRDNLSADHQKLLVSAEKLGLRYLETRSNLEMEYYYQVGKLADEIINATFSKAVIIPHQTTCEDVEWFMKETVNNLGLTYWFEPTIDLQRTSGMFSGDTVILPGDLLHCDFGIKYLGLCSDTQRLAYVLSGDDDLVLKELEAGLKENNHFQDIVVDLLKVNKTGNEVFINALKQAQDQGMKAMLYSHPIGGFGHGAGPTIGLFSNQNPQPIAGELVISDNTAYALELNTKRALTNYEKEVFFFTEESILLKDNQVTYLGKGRDKLILI